MEYTKIGTEIRELMKVYSLEEQQAAGIELAQKMFLLEEKKKEIDEIINLRASEVRALQSVISDIEKDIGILTNAAAKGEALIPTECDIYTSATETVVVKSGELPTLESAVLERIETQVVPEIDPDAKDIEKESK
jgi:hypothetical protein